MINSLSILYKETERVHNLDTQLQSVKDHSKCQKVLVSSVEEKYLPISGMHHAVISYSFRQNMLFKSGGFTSCFSGLGETILIFKCTNTCHKRNEVFVIWNYTDSKRDLGVDFLLYTGSHISQYNLNKLFKIVKEDLDVII